MRYQVVKGVDCFEVGIQQLLDFTNCGLGSCISRVVKDDFVVVRITCEFGQIGRPCVTSVFRNFSDAVNSASLLTMVEYDCMASRRFDMYFCYEVWHVMDDGDLWQAWDHDAELSRVDAPVLLDERDIDDDEVDHVQLWSLCIRGAGPVSFLWLLHRGELVEEYFNSDWYGQQPKRIRGADWCDWSTVEDLLDTYVMVDLLTRAVEWALTSR